VIKPLNYSHFDFKPLLIAAALVICALTFCMSGELQGQASLPLMNTGPDSNFSQVDFAQMFLDNTNKQQQKNAEIKEQRQHMVDSGVVSRLDLDASGKALDEYNRAAALMKGQHSKEAIVHLQKAIAAYPKFVLAYNTLGLAYLDQGDPHAKEEFEKAAQLDSKFPGSFLHLGMLELAAKDFTGADSELSKAASLSPNDPNILAALAFAENGDHKYAETLQTVEHLHTLEHHAFANVHYVAASAAMALNNYDVMERELKLFLAEAPADPLAPVARQNLATLENRKNAAAKSATGAQAQMLSAPNAKLQTFPNSDRLKAELKGAGEEQDNENCDTCKVPESNEVAANAGAAAPNSSLAAYARAGVVFTIHQAVDETALYFAVSNHGHMVSDLKLPDIQIRDDNKPPERIIQFIPQSKLPLRLGLLIDTSGSVHDRFTFEKHAAEKFIEKVLNGTSDLGFVVGFSGDTTVTRDFVADPAELAKGIEALKNGGGTALFDAVAYSCRKLADYPETGRVARVLVVLSDGEDNSSHRSLKQAIEHAESAGVTVYAVSTSEDNGDKTDADHILQVLAERSGGEAMFPGDMMVFGRSLDRLRDLIRSRYLLAYKPAGFEPNGKYRPIHVVAEQDGKHLRVHVRKGYYARLAETSH
jgi:Ca-activated chloride channel family protein